MLVGAVVVEHHVDDVADRDIILLTADGLGTNAIMRGTGRAKSVVWRWQERFMCEGLGGPTTP
jgi:hypothetical protein